PTLYRAVGCRHCNNRGFRGRGGIFELVTVDDRVRSMIHKGASEQDIERYALAHMPTLRMDGIRRILAGETTIDEVLRVTIEDTMPVEA
ncbi:MAG: type II secretion system protein GspE, partial [Ectothiorhodospiraceae bacterium]